MDDREIAESDIGSHEEHIYDEEFRDMTLVVT